MAGDGGSKPPAPASPEAVLLEALFEQVGTLDGKRLPSADAAQALGAGLSAAFAAALQKWAEAPKEAAEAGDDDDAR